MNLLPLDQRVPDSLKTKLKRWKELDIQYIKIWVDVNPFNAEVWPTQTIKLYGLILFGIYLVPRGQEINFIFGKCKPR